jgi:hypothetical protein
MIKVTTRTSFECVQHPPHYHGYKDNLSIEEREGEVTLWHGCMGSSVDSYDAAIEHMKQKYKSVTVVSRSVTTTIEMNQEII